MSPLLALLALCPAATLLAMDDPTRVSDADATYDRNLEAIRQNVGIGLGTLLWAHAGTGLLSQVCAATTNGTYGNQTFAVTTGTSYAKHWDKIADNHSREFIRDNLDQLTRDLAVGRGECLDALAELQHVPVDQRPAWCQRLQARFGDIIDRPDCTADDVADRIQQIAG